MIKGDGSLGGIGDSPIHIRETSTLDLTEADQPETTSKLEAPQGRIEESEDELQSMVKREDKSPSILFSDSNSDWDTDDVQTEVEVNNERIVSSEGNSLTPSPIFIQDDDEDNKEADSEVAEVFAENGAMLSLSYKDDITKSIKQVLPSPGESLDEDRKSKGVDSEQGIGRNSPVDKGQSSPVDEGQNSPVDESQVSHIDECNDYDVDDFEKSEGYSEV